MFCIHFFKPKKVKFQLSSSYYFILQFNYIHTELKPLCKMDYTCIWRYDLMTVVHYSKLFIQHAYNYIKSHFLLQRTHLSYSVHTYYMCELSNILSRKILEIWQIKCLQVYVFFLTTVFRTIMSERLFVEWCIKPIFSLYTNNLKIWWYNFWCIQDFIFLIKYVT